MKKLIIVAILGVVGWQIFEKYQRQSFTVVDGLETAGVKYTPSSNSRGDRNLSSTFKCDGRVYCSQMTSCEEATFFLRNCPSVKMDGDNDGIPCENQWCN